MDIWDNIYRQEGPVQIEPSVQVARLVPLFISEGAQLILDLGCGTGRHVRYLAENGFHVAGTDNSAEAISVSRTNTQGLDNVFLRQAEMDLIPYPNRLFDAVVCNHVIQHGYKPQRDGAFSEIYRVLKRDGILFLRTISRAHVTYGTGTKVQGEEHTFVDLPEVPDGKVPHHFFSKEELEYYLEGYEIISIEHNTRPPKEDGFWKKRLDELVVLAAKL